MQDMNRYLIFFKLLQFQLWVQNLDCSTSSGPSDLQIKKPEEVKEVKDMSERN